MRGITRLIEGLLHNDPTALAVLGFTVVGTVAIVLVTEVIQRKRKKNQEGK